MIKKLIFLGAPGVGKGTIAKLLAKKKSLEHISTGDIFRKNIKEKTKLGQKVKTILEVGEYVPDELTNEIVKDTLNHPNIQAKGFILDGFPRTLNQAEFLKKQFGDVTAVLLEAPHDVIMERLLLRSKKENRNDDAPEVVAKRLKVYNEQTAPLINWYKNEGLLIITNASGNINENMKEIMEHLY